MYIAGEAGYIERKVGGEGWQQQLKLGNDAPGHLPLYPIGTRLSNTDDVAKPPRSQAR